MAHLQGELNSILAFVEQLGELDTEGVEPMTGIIPMQLPMREDVVRMTAIMPSACWPMRRWPRMDSSPSRKW